MSSMYISGNVFLCIFAGALLGMLLRFLLPEKHLSAGSQNLVNLAMGLVGTMAALVLGLLVSSAKTSFDNQRLGVDQLSANIIMLDRILAHYGSDAKETREILKFFVDDLIQRTWHHENLQLGQAVTNVGTEGRYERLYEIIHDLVPKNDGQRTLQAQAQKICFDIAQTRWLLFAQRGSSIPIPLLAVMVCWLALILTSFSLFAPPNPTVFFTLFLSSVAVTSAVYLILEMDRPFDGVIQISSAPLRSALAELGR